MSMYLSSEDEACLQGVIGSLVVSGTLRQALETEGIIALRTHEDYLLTAITPGAWRVITKIAPRTYVDLAVAIENELQARAPHAVGATGRRRRPNAA
jgi:hypothetical protein